MTVRRPRPHPIPVQSCLLLCCVLLPEHRVAVSHVQLAWCRELCPVLIWGLGPACIPTAEAQPRVL